jgi:hypothetical protein
LTQETLIQLIHLAFKGVTLEGGISWNRALSICLELPPYTEDSEAETTDDWASLVLDPGWTYESEGNEVFKYLDPEGFRYYLPAALVRAVYSEGEILCSFLMSLENGGEDPRWSALDSQQKICVAKVCGAIFRGRCDRAGDPWFEYYESYWKQFDPHSSMARESLISEVYTAFDGVSRLGGVSWSETHVIDNYGSMEARLQARALDHDSSWEALVDDLNWDWGDGITGFSFLDPIAYRYYLPAAMIRDLRCGETSLYTLRSDEINEQQSLLTPEMKKCVSRFLLYFDEEVGLNGWEIWGEAYNNFWHRFNQ